MKVLYVLKRYPRLSETFIVRELIGIESAGIEVGIDALLGAEEGVRHQEVDRVKAIVRYVPRRPATSASATLGAHFRVFVRAPRRWTAEARQALSAARSDRPWHRSDPWRRFLQAGFVADRLRRERFDHVHAHFATAASDVAVPAAKMAGVPVTVTAHAKDIFLTANADRLKGRLGRVDTIISISAFNVDHMRSIGVNRPIVHVPNGVALGTAHGGDRNGPILCVTRLVEKKGIDTLIEAVSLLKHDRPNLRVEIVGGGPLLGDLKELSAQLGVSDRVLFAGPQPSTEVDAAYARCSMVVLPCRVTSDGDRDGLPTVLVEALARAIPVVSTSVVGIPELVRDGDTGLLVQPDDPSALATAMDKLLSNPDLARELGSRGRALVASEYDPATSCELLIATWKAIS
jgi:glycosyltransferase involved in cell wall biosynthesis